MFLKRMDLKGFKSFANLTRINFKDGLTIIVGPNGSGKSNINDALKWVLGEASKKTLRASEKKDMIFSGSAKQEAANYAMVTLYFDNSKRIIDFPGDEVVISRKSYVDKDQNEYYINNELVRRKDVRNLFLDTGLGNTDLSIISQGSVSKVMEAKPQELKELLNEAAGVSKYKNQKYEALLKLDHVSSNLDVFDTKLSILNKQIKPLKTASSKAQEFFKIKQELSKIELPLLKTRLSFFTSREKTLKKELELLEKRRVIIDEKKKNLETENLNLQKKLLDLDKEIENLQIKQMELQNSSFTGNISDVDDKVLEKRIKELGKNITDLKKILVQTEKEEEKINLLIRDLKRDDFELTSFIDQLKSSIEKVKYELLKLETDENKFNRPVKKILENINMFNTIYGTVENLISYENQYEVAIKIALGSKLNNIVVSDETVIKKAVNFLKNNKYGTATFIPSDKVVPKFISGDYLNVISQTSGYVGVLSEFININSKFKNVAESLAGNILLFINLDDAMSAAKFIKYRYKIITLDGDLIYPGFVVRGGYNNQKAYVEHKEKFVNAKNKLESNLKEKETELGSLREKLIESNTERNAIQSEEIRSAERLNYLETQLQQSLNAYKNITGKNYNINKLFEEFSTESSKGVFSSEQINSDLRLLKQKKVNLNSNIIVSQEEQNSLNHEWAKIIETISSYKLELSDIENYVFKNLEILRKDYELTLDGLLNSSNISFLKNENAIDEIEKNRDIIRQKLSELGYVDLESIKKFEELEKEYNLLKENTDDLKNTHKKLLSTIDIMDKEMMKRISVTFEEVSLKFNEIFQMLFRGGFAKLMYLDPDNILDSGVEIVASAPGKKVKNLSLYSGGEKSLIALSLIFAINIVRKLPLLFLDEVEAALDEANVERFANFAKYLNKYTQLIIVSHRPGTMEKADYLYGVTMQERGVTDIFNVKLQEAIQISS